jgi:hypothetical protein
MILAMLSLFAVPAWSQSDQNAPQSDLWEGAVNLTANLQGETTAAGVTDRATYSGGILFNIRYRFHGNLAVEANGGFTTFTQYYQPVSGQEQANIYEGTAGIAYSFRAPQDRLRPFVEVGGGVLYFSPVATGSTPGGSKVLQPNGFGGFGVDWRKNKNFSFRAGFRGLAYRPPSFNLASQTLSTITVMSEPYVGLVLRF